MLSCLGCDGKAIPDQKRSEPFERPTKANRQPIETPSSYTDHVPAFSNKEDDISFQMLLIPGDKAQGIKPFYIAETEVTWGMMKDWMYQIDLSDQGLTAQERAEIEIAGLRPSLIYGQLVTTLLADDTTRPASGVSLRTAQTFCDWLSQQTGRAYRLPTDNEWLHVFQLSGGIPSKREVLANQAVFADTGGFNGNDEFGQPYFQEYVTRPVKSKQPNKLGLYDFLGNVSEWVQPTGEERWVRGGHFMLKKNEFNCTWRAAEDQEIWNETYPQLPRSESWYFDKIFPGLRLVCEAGSIEVE